VQYQQQQVALQYTQAAVVKATAAAIGTAHRAAHAAETLANLVSYFVAMKVVRMENAEELGRLAAKLEDLESELEDARDLVQVGAIHCRRVRLYLSYVGRLHNNNKVTSLIRHAMLRGERGSCEALPYVATHTTGKHGS
jgi:hypothetical protein